MTSKHPMTWILVADGKQAQVYVRARVERQMPPPFEQNISHEPVPVMGMRWEAESVNQYQLGRDATGMVFSSSGSARHMAEPHIDAHEEVKHHFALTIAKALGEARAKKQFEHLVLVAPPKMLGDIRKHLDQHVLATVVAELPKELTHVDGETLLDHLQHLYALD